MITPQNKRISTKWVLPTITAVVIAIGSITVLISSGCSSKNNGGSNTDTITSNDTTVAAKAALCAGAVSDSIEKDTLSQSSLVKKPVISYRIKNAEGADDRFDDNSQLCAIIDGEHVTIGSISYIFGEYCHGNMHIFAEEDFDGDGITEALVYDANMGNGGGSSWVFVSYVGDNSFKKSGIFSECSYYEPEISTVKGVKVLDFIKVDLGERVVRERHGLKNGEEISLPLPSSKTKAYTILQSINMEDLGEYGSFTFDLNGDGQDETITSTGASHFIRLFEFYMNGKKYEFNVDSMWGGGTLHILKSKTKGMRDIMAEDESRIMYKWDGSTYKSTNRN